MNKKNNIIIYQTEDGRTKIDIRFENKTLWMSQKQIAELFQTTVPNIAMHIKAILEDAELSLATVKNYLIVQNEGIRQVERQIEHYSLDMILAVGYSNKYTKQSYRYCLQRRRDKKAL